MKQGRARTSRVRSDCVASPSPSSDALSRAVAMVVEPLELRTLLSGISGQVWDDTDGDGIRDAGESGLANWTVYLDQNRNRAADAGEAITTTDATGNYSFTGLAAGTYYVAQQIPVAWRQTYPGQGGQIVSVPSIGVSVDDNDDINMVGNAPAMTYTGADVPVYLDGIGAFDENGDIAVRPSDAESNVLINLDDLRNDPRFAGIDGSGFSVAVLDTGIDLNHPFFGADADANGISDRIVYQWDFADNDANATDVNGHGSNVSSIIAGQDATYGGMAPGADIIALKVFSDTGVGFFSYIESALQWVVANAAAYNIAAVNMSLSDLQNHATAQQLYGISDELAALAAMDVIVVSAAGNDYYQYQVQGVAYPAADPNSLAVGATYDASLGQLNYSSGAIDYTTGPDRITSFSQRSTTLTDIFAPGALITGANATGGLASYTGTSQAAPHIAGLVALAQQLADQYLGRRLTFSEFRDLLVGTGTVIFDGDDENDNVPNTNASYLRVDAFAMADAIAESSSAYPYGYTILIGDGQTLAGVNFGDQQVPIVPDAPILTSSTDSGISNSDRITNYDNSTIFKSLTFTVGGTFAGSTVAIYADGVQIGSNTGADGTTSVTTLGTIDLSDGVHTITARQTVSGRPQSTDSAALSITIDTAAPAAPSQFQLQSASDSGISSSDNLTNDTTPTFNLTAAPYFRVLRNGSTVSANYATGSTFQMGSLLTEGAHVFAAYAVDVAGNLSTAVSRTVTIDTTPWQQPSIHDPTFGTNGTLLIPGKNGQAKATAIQSDGKIIVGGYSGETQPFQTSALVSRLNANGTLDTSFGTSGWTTLTPGYSNQVHAVIVLASGKILIGGNADTSGGLFQAFIARLNANGTLDTTFGTNGIVIPPTTVMAQLYDLHELSDGRFLAGGYAVTNGGDFAAARYSANGTLDTTFGTGGSATVNIVGSDRGMGMAVATDGKIVLTGYVGSPIVTGVARLTSTGQLDTTFDGDGKATLAVGVSGTIAYAAVVQLDGKVVVAGYKSDGPSTGLQDAFLARYNVNGSLDPTFGSGGIVVHDLGGLERIEDVLLQPDGKIVTVGLSNNSMSTRRFTTNGTPDSSFGPNGAVQTKPNVIEAWGFGGALQNDGKVVSVGFWTDGTISGMGVARISPGSATPALDLTAGSDTGISSTDNVTNDNTPTFTAPSVPNGEYYRVFRNGVLISASYVSGATFTPGTQSDGTTPYTVQAVDAAGNESGVSAVLTVTIDTVAPSTPTALDLATSSDTGALSTDNITNDSTPTFNIFNLPADTYYRVLRAGVQVSGSYETAGTYTVPVQPDSTTAWTRQFVDVAGNASAASAALNVTIDTVRPTILSTFVNDATTQRSMVTSLTVTFAEAVQNLAGMFDLLLSSGLVPDGTAVTVTPQADARTFVLTFSGSKVIAESLDDGIYTLFTRAASTRDVAGNGLLSDQSLTFHRLFGDSDGDRDVDAIDSLRFRQAQNTALGNAAYKWYFDFDGDDDVDSLDALRFRQRQGIVLTEATVIKGNTKKI